jgi:hypothetical protein
MIVRSNPIVVRIATWLHALFLEPVDPKKQAKAIRLWVLQRNELEVHTPVDSPSYIPEYLIAFVAHQRYRETDRNGPQGVLLTADKPGIGGTVNKRALNQSNFESNNE